MTNIFAWTCNTCCTEQPALECCPRCGGPLELEHVATAYEIDDAYAEQRMAEINAHWDELWGKRVDVPETAPTYSLPGFLRRRQA